MVTHVPISQISAAEPDGGHRGYVNVDTGIDFVNLHLGILHYVNKPIAVCANPNLCMTEQVSICMIGQVHLETMCERRYKLMYN